jgi:DNA-binding response OmpR family regulator
MFNILVVEDDQELRDLFCTVLIENGYTTFSAVDGLGAFDILERTFIDLIISDVMMPNMDGFEMTKALRTANYTMPILMITAKSGMADKHDGFKVGVDDYMVKPIDVNEMVWRVEALLRRSQAVKDRSLCIGSTEFNCDTLTVTNDHEKIELPQKEFFLIYKLVSSVDRIFTRRQILDEIWGFESEADPHTLEVHISRLREKFKNNEDFDIVTIRGLGYKAVKRNE